MTATLLTLVAIAYGWTAYTYYADGRVGMMVAFIAYAAANVGFIMDSQQ